MSIKVSFKTGERAVTVGGLYQWDYGQVLEIECTELGTELMEVHFACPNMSEALVRACQFVDGVGTVTIPDQCLEQTSNITAWIYSISGTQGHTVKTITMPITGRTRPSALRDVPSEYINKYAEAIEEINEAVNAIEQGNITAAKALSADTATSADTAKNAENATYATSAGSATTAGSANTATTATGVTPPLVASATITDGVGTIPTEIKKGNLYFVVFAQDNATHSGVFYWANTNTDVNECCIGSHQMSFLTGDAGNNSIRIGNQNGTLKFYKLGGISG